MTVDLQSLQTLPAALAGSATATTATTAAAAMTPAMERALSSNFASVARWRGEFISLVEAHAGEPGRVELAFAARDGSLLNRWVPPEAGSDAAVLLAMPLPVNDAAAAPAFVAGIDWAPTGLPALSASRARGERAVRGRAG